MKTLLATAACVAVVAIGSPTFAQSTQGQSVRSARDAFAQAQPQRRASTTQRRRAAARSAFAAAPGPDGIVHSSNPANDVYDGSGEYLGSDPDPFVRNSLMFDNDGDGD